MLWILLLRRRTIDRLLLRGCILGLLLLLRWGRIVHRGTPRTILLLRRRYVWRIIRTCVVARTALDLLGCGGRSTVLLDGRLLRRCRLLWRTSVHRRHVVRNDATCRIELDADAWAGWALLMCGLLRDGDGALARR